MKIVQATDSFESWLATQMTPVVADLRLKHAKMADPHSPFMFLRATFYRWAQRWKADCPELAKLTSVLAVGDLHVENFGTWRDREGRLAWGVNDFDEASELSFANDLVRLCVSAVLSTEGDRLSIDPQLACESIFEGYQTGITSFIEEAASPVVIDEKHRWFEPLLADRRPDRFWQRRREEIGLSSIDPPASAKNVLVAAMPSGCESCKFAARVAGVGSLGRPRFFALSDWNGGPIAREAKVLLPSASVWAGLSKQKKPAYEAILKRAIRSPDPILYVKDGWIVRRLAPDSDKLELSSGGRATDAVRLLRAMGCETAHTHAPDSDALKSIRKDLKTIAGKPFRIAVMTKLEATRKDWADWKDSRGKLAKD